MLIACGLILLLSGCASYSYTFESVENAIARQQPDQALHILEKLQRRGLFFKKADVLYELNKAMILRMQQRYRESNAAFEQAKRLMEKYDAISLTEQAGSLVINDATRAYVGAPFEQVLLHLYSALNYLQLGQRDEARVEALQVDQRLQQLNERIKNPIYTEDAFARYLNGIIYEELGEYSDAMIACRKSYQAYQKYRKYFAVSTPESLQKALLRLSRQQGLEQEYRNYENTFNLPRGKSVYERRQFAELVYVLSSGLAPVKKEHSVNVIAPTSGQFVRVALPYYEERPDDLAGVRLILRNTASGLETPVSGELVQDIDNIAEKTLQSQLPAITARAAARAVAKYQLTREVGRQDQLLGILSNIVNVVTERADTRSWLTLPKHIYLARVAIEPGVYDIEVEFLSAYGHILETKQLRHVVLKAGHSDYLAYRRVSSVALQ
jgi:hypothetical protein